MAGSKGVVDPELYANMAYSNLSSPSNVNDVGFHSSMRDKASGLREFGAGLRKREWDAEDRQARLSSRSAPVTSSFNGMGLTDPYTQEDSRYKERAKFDQELAGSGLRNESDVRLREAERLMKMRMDMLTQLLMGSFGGMGGRGKSSTQTTNASTNGVDYHTVGGRPIAMPTYSNSSQSTTTSEKGMSREALLSALMEMFRS